MKNSIFSEIPSLTSRQVHCSFIMPCNSTLMGTLILVPNLQIYDVIYFFFNNRYENWLLKFGGRVV